MANEGVVKSVLNSMPYIYPLFRNILYSQIIFAPEPFVRYVGKISALETVRKLDQRLQSLTGILSLGQLFLDLSHGRLIALNLAVNLRDLLGQRLPQRRADAAGERSEQGGLVVFQLGDFDLQR